MNDTRAFARAGRTFRAVGLAGATTLALVLASGCSSGGRDPGDIGGARNEITAGAKTLPAAVPDHIAIPDLGVDADLGAVGLDARGVMQTPPYDEPMRADWYKEGPTPGERGASVVVGHKDTPQQKDAVFHDVDELKKGQEIDIRRKDGTTAVFQVDAVHTFKKSQFPTGTVYGGTDRAELRLITCGGELTADRHWDSNTVVFAHLTGHTAAQ